MTKPVHERRLYRNEALRAVAMPLGGIGTGSIALAGDGSLRQWQIHNQVNHVACVPHSFFAVWAKPERSSELPVSRALQSSALYDVAEPPVPPTSNDHFVPLCHRRLLQQVPGVQTIEFTGEYPIAELRYLDDKLPLIVEMEAFNPFVPLDTERSSIPALIFNITISNPATRPYMAAVAGAFQNAVGWDGVAPIFDTKCQNYGGNVNTVVKAGDLTIISMENTVLPEDHANFGSMALSIPSPQATYISQWNDLRAFWEDFSVDGRLSNISDTTPSRAGQTWNSALAIDFTLQPGETRTIPFVLAWYFPNRYVNYSQRRYFEFTDDKSKLWLGNHYNNRYRSALDVTIATFSELEELSAETRRSRDTFFDSTLPNSLIDAVTSQMSIIRSPSCFWIEDGSFFGFEGCNGVSTPNSGVIGGCCPLNCTHVWNYEMTLARLFPQLERNMRDTEWNLQQHPTGYLPHRVLLPTYLPPVWDRPLAGPANPALDGLLGAILKTYREYLASGDESWLAHHWPAINRALEHLWTAHDPDRTGVIEGEQPNTYDISIYGANTFIGTLYLAALHASAEMAQRIGDSETSVTCLEIASRGRQALEARLWNGEYYIQEVDLDTYPEQNWGLGCHADHLFGQWWAHYLGLGHVLDADHVHSAANAIVSHNFREDFRGFEQKPRVYCTEDDEGLLNCTWPNGGRPDVPTLYSDEIWTGMEYEVAGLLIYEGEVESALRILDASRRRYDGRKQNPWNDIECGDHYVRAMSSWALLEAATGYHYDASRAMIRFAPAFQQEGFRAPFIARDGWGTFDHQISSNKHETSLHLKAGRLTLDRLELGGLSSSHRVESVTLGGQPVNATTDAVNGMLVIDFVKPTTIRRDEELRVHYTVL